MVPTAPWNRLLPASLQRQLGVVGAKPGLLLTPRTQTPPSRTISPDGHMKQARRAQLAHVFEVFDLDGSGMIEASELLELGKARRALGQKQGAWNERSNARMFKNMDTSQDGSVCQTEFINYFEGFLPKRSNEFDAVLADFLVVAETCRANKQRSRADAEQEKAREATAKLDPLSPRYSRPIRCDIDDDHNAEISASELLGYYEDQVAKHNNNRSNTTPQQEQVPKSNFADELLASRNRAVDSYAIKSTITNHPSPREHKATSSQREKADSSIEEEWRAREARAKERAYEREDRVKPVASGRSGQRLEQQPSGASSSRRSSTASESSFRSRTREDELIAKFGKY